MTQKKFIVVAMEYFTKWIEAETLATITERQMKLIVYIFGVHRLILTDNGICFRENLKNFYTHRQIALAQSSVKMPQKKWSVGEAKGTWPEELPGTLWALQTTAHTVIGETTFSLVYGTEAVIPVEIGMRSHRTQHFEEGVNQEPIRLNLDLIDGFREVVEIKNATRAQQVARYYNSKVKKIVPSRRSYPMKY
ncbi:rve domain-containing protein [Gossypium australe]|uniref:Rve domain-containing protein n=1 Tax=Gossypium australe TaxID=47621 RepID=A0A5B6WRE1_9ROSI|nr:rve domain-containing protein [Gossypium australe]